SGQPPAPDEWSDHDFFVVTVPGAQEPLRADPGWLPDADRVVLWHRETPHGVKAIWDDGHLAELAVFDDQELGVARVNRFRVLLDRGGVAARMAQVRVATVALARREAPDERWLAGQLLGALLVGAGRFARGERASGRHLVHDVATGHLLALAARVVPVAPGAVGDDLDPFRRLEQTRPAVARALEAALDGPVPDGALGLLDLAEEHLAPRLDAWPALAARVVRARIAAARGPAATPS
ncbi:MAG TPA: hypothetical protein VFO65_02350, partial [Acidimicrobiales bacterium]|nr:hypothetical protein [Acidimicrobiales bacterium]